MTMGLEKRCSNCKRGVPIYRKGDIIAHLCEYDFDNVRDGKYLAEDTSDIIDCKYWKEDE